MSDELQLSNTKHEYGEILAKLAELSRDLLLTFRLEVGRVMLDAYFGGSAHAYLDQSPNKVTSFNEFTKTCQDDLADYGLSGPVLAQCIRARITWDGLPSQVRDQLRFNHVVALASVGEPNDRARLAFDATREGWSVTQLKDAIAQLMLGNYYDTDAAQAGTQPPPAKPEEQKAAQPGRLVSRLEKAMEDLDTWAAEWTGADTSKLRGPQRERAKKAMADLKAKVAAVEALLG